MELIHRHACRNRTQTIDKFTFDHLSKLIHKKSPIAQGLRSTSDAFFCGVYGYIKFNPYVHPHPIFGNQSPITSAAHLKTQCFHIYGAAFVQKGDDNRSSIDDHTFSPSARFHQRRFTCCAFIKFCNRKSYQNQENCKASTYDEK